VLTEKIKKTLILAFFVCSAALCADYVVSVVLLHTPQVFSALKTFILTLALTVPVGYFLISQRIDIQAVKDALLKSISEHAAALADIEAVNLKLKEGEALYRLLADNQTDIISLWAADGANLYTSSSAERWFGFTNAERNELEHSVNLHPEDAERALAARAAVTVECGHTTAEFRVLAKDGSVLWVETTFKRVADGSNQVLTATRVITERKMLEQELHAALDQAKSALAVKADFLANMTHELRTPLNAIVGFSGLLRKSEAIKQPEKRHVELIYDASQTLLSVVNDVLDFSKLEADAVELEHHPFDPLQITEATAALLTTQANAKGVDLRVVRLGAEDLLIGDSARLRQVILNFLSNALKFTATGAIEVTVDQKHLADQRRLRIAVKDSGIGIPEHHVDAVFGRFTQADASVSRKFGGTGLGLAICKKLIEAMDGEIGVTSEVGSGSTFWFEVTLPVAHALENDERDVSDDIEIGSSFRLLVVDDNAVNRELLTVLLSQFDISITNAADGVEAVEHAARSTFDLILMDVQMPNMDGMTATRRIRSATPVGAQRVPIVAMTANVFPEQIARCMEAGMDGHLGKPIIPAKIIETLEYWSSVANAESVDEYGHAISG
jgi:PAS domain S-box-containing protein